MMSVQPAGDAALRVSPPLSGKTFGIDAAAGMFLTRAVAVEGELAFGGTIAAPQRFFYTWREDYSAQSRDVLLNANIRWRPAAIRYVELSGGGGLAISTFAERSIIYTDSFGRASTTADRSETGAQPTLGGSVAAVLPANPRVDILPTFSVRWVKRSENGTGAYIGAGSYAYQFGASMRFKL